ncbi:MAG: phosphatidylcholine/phosphatidylserine synthase [Planctomycetes bacterium]|nr:phosphatidylcholine/phosphatidylserine synthase [Planctomycetota bacterium]
MTSGRNRRRRRIRERAREGLAILPSLLTLGNMLCGFYAIVHVASVQWNAQGVPHPERAFFHASVAILLAMVFDMLDGRVARMTRTTSDFGGQLDSLADAISFGVAPAVMVAMLNSWARWGWAEDAQFWAKMSWVFGAAYAAGAVIRLARFNTETSSHSEEAHRYFKGLPSPAAAGVIASLVLLQYYLQSPRSRLSWVNPEIVNITALLPFVALAVGYLMVSQFRYVHVANVLLRGRKPFEYLTAVVFGGVLFALFPEPALALLFCGFASTGPVLAFYRWMHPQPTPLALGLPAPGLPADRDAPPEQPAAPQA